MPDGVDSSSEPLGTLIARAYPDLRRIAAAKAAGSRLSPSSLAQEAVCRLLRLPVPPESEDAVRAAGFRLIEWTLLDRVRADRSRRVREAASARSQEPLSSSKHSSLEQLSEALLELAELSPRKAEIMTLSAVCGLTMPRIAEVLEISTKTVQRDLEFARAWIAAWLNGENSEAQSPKGDGAE